MRGHLRHSGHHQSVQRTGGAIQTETHAEAGVEHARTAPRCTAEADPVMPPAFEAPPPPPPADPRMLLPVAPANTPLGIAL